MRRLIMLLCLLGLFAAPTATPELAAAADSSKHSLKTMKSGSSRAKALNYHNKAQKQKPSAKKFRLLEQRANAMRGKLRHSGATASPDQQWANYIAPLNRCTDLVRKTCGSEKQCAAQGGCSLAVQLLDLYNAEPNIEEKYEIENTCIAALSDHVFPSCE